MDEDLKARLLKPRLPEDTVELPGVGSVVVRGLSRSEARQLQGQDEETVERKMLAFATGLSEDEVAAWQQTATAGEIDTVAARILDLSAMDAGAPKEAVKSL